MDSTKRGNVSAVAPSEKLWWSCRDVAERWEYSTQTIERYCKSGLLPAMRPGGSGHWRIHFSAIAATEAQGQRQAINKAVVNSKRNRRHTPSGIDHFGDGE